MFVDDTSARASLVDAATTVSLEFRFDAEGLINTVHAAARARMINGALVATPWQGRFWAHDVRDGMRVPMQGEVAWLLPEGPSVPSGSHLTRSTGHWARMPTL
jgi:hypothetical protein